jgi:uncharacterized membrane protein YhaH (DUF805 family)
LHTLLAFWRGRASRREYWLSLAGYLVFYGLLVVLMGPGLASLLGFPFWMVIGARRLHDFGANALWAALPFGIGFVGGFAGGWEPPFPRLEPAAPTISCWPPCRSC